MPIYPSEKIGRYDRIPVVGSCVLYVNTDQPEHPQQGWLGKIIGETYKGVAHHYTVRWYNGLVDHEVTPEFCVHV